MSVASRIGRSIRGKVMLLVVATTVAALGLNALGLVAYDLSLYERQWSADMLSQAEVLARTSAPALAFGDRETAQRGLAVMQVRPRVLAVALYSRDGRIFASYARDASDAMAFPAAPGAEGFAVDNGQLTLFRPVVENGVAIGTIYLRAIHDPWARLKDYLAILVAVMVASLVAATLISSWLQRSVTEPILEVARLARNVMRKRDYSLRARKTTEDEIGQLVDAFNGMLAEVGKRSEQLRLSDQRKDEFLAILAHELRNPLAPIRNALEILRIAGDDPQKAAFAREIMQRQVSQMVRLVDDLVDISRVSTGKLAVRKEVIDLQDVVRDAIEIARPFIESRKHHLDVTFDPEPSRVEGDRLRLAQVYSNLMNNAAKYTESGGHIAIFVGTEGSEAVVRVRDDGIGLAPGSTTSIFDMFMQVDRTLERLQAGLGVGLTLARRLIELHGGTIEAKSAGLGQGSEFIVRLPLSHARFEQTARREGASGPLGPSRRVLIADDNVDFATSLGALLAGRGHDVRVVNDGAHAFAMAVEFTPDIAFVDIGMPRINGYEVARRMRADPTTAACVLVAVTGWGQDSDRERAREAGFDRHLVKPVDPGEIDLILRRR
jgi:signal transduction histidine kinase